MSKSLELKQRPEDAGVFTGLAITYSICYAKR